MKIPIKHYVEVSEVTPLEEALGTEIVNEGGKQYLVEVWA